MATATAKDASGQTFTFNLLPPTGPAAKAGSLPFTLASDDPAALAMIGLLFGASFTDKSVTLTSAQAAGNDPVLPANPNRKALIIVPPNACVLSIAVGASTGIPLLGSTENSRSGPLCPSNALYLAGLSTGNIVTILEA